MDSRKAKEILLLYREGVDDDDPQFAAALEQAEHDPDLAEWLHHQQHSYTAVRTKLREIEPPPDLRGKILAGQPMLLRPTNVSPWLKLAASILIFAGVAVWFSWHPPQSRALTRSGEEITVTGEVLDMACYIASNLSGPEHAECARTCIRKGLPVGIKDQNDGKVYLLVGAADSLNNQLADYAAKTITVKGKLRTRDGFVMLDEVTIKKL